MTTVAQIRLNLTPGEFDLIRSTLEVAAQENRLAVSDEKRTAKERHECRERSAQQTSLLNRMNKGTV